jgi:hypothetical protein
VQEPRTLSGDIPEKPEPLLKFLDDRDPARLMATARDSTDPCDWLGREPLAGPGCEVWLWLTVGQKRGVSGMESI